jgi:hypothetical protein
MKTFSREKNLEHNDLRGMTKASSSSEILEKAKEKEERYEWLKAAVCFQEALNSFCASDFQNKGKISESLRARILRVLYAIVSFHK